jgi:predicted flap endonuclease-1-like 5' DNA nuclease
MTILDQVLALDQRILDGRTEDAFAEFFHDEAVTQVSPQERTSSKAEKQRWLASFFMQVATAEEVRLHSYAVNGNVSFSEFTFRFTLHDGQTKEWVEVIRRWWQDGLVMDEKYYIGAKTDEPTVLPMLSATTQTEPADNAPGAGMDGSDEPLYPQTTFDVIVAPDGTLTEIADTVEHMGDITTERIEILNKTDGTAIELVTVEQPSGLPNLDQVDKLVLIEGIGPKIAELLTQAGILTFAQLADTPVERVREILAGGGSRFRIQDATTWGEQARLLADGNHAAFKTLTDELKGGRRVS